MSIADRLAEVFGLRPLFGYHDLDLLHEPSGAPAIASADASPRLGSCVDGPAVQGGEASTAGHPNVDWDAIREGIAELRTVLVDALAWLDEIDPTAAGLTKPKVRCEMTVNNSHSAVLDELAARRQQTPPHCPQ